jgi:protein ImuB
VRVQRKDLSLLSRGADFPKRMAMAFACIFVPNFMVQAMVRREPALRDCAVALVDGTSPLWSVVGVNEVAAETGIRLGMTKPQAQQFRAVEIRHRSRAQERAAHAALMDLGWSVSPRIEDTAPDTIVLDLAGLNSLYGPDETIAAQLAERALRLGLITRIATASKMDAAIFATRGFAGITVIPEGEESEILGSLPIHVLAPSAEVRETLDRWGVRTCAALAALPVLELSERLGQEGVRLHELARAQSERSMVPAELEVHFEEEMELEDALGELEPLAFLLGRLLDQLCVRLDARSLAACAVRVRFELDPGLEDFGDTSGASPHILNHRGGQDIHRPPPTPVVDSGTSRHSMAGLGGRSGQKIYERVLNLPVPMRDSKMLLKLLRLHLQSDAPRAPIVKMIVALDAARPRLAQGDLFLPCSPDPEKLELTVARLANLVGDEQIGSPELMDTHRPGEFRMCRFVAPRDAAETRRAVRRRADQKGATIAESGAGSKEKPSLPKTGFRVFRPALPARVDLREGCPAWVTFFGSGLAGTSPETRPGLRGHVLAASGPWRSSGDWWREDGWHNDEWDLEIEFSSAPEKRVSSAFEPRVSPAREAQASATLDTRVGAVPHARSPETGGANRSAANPAKTSPRRGFYRVFYDAIRKEWFVRGTYD